jgi:hypothetical protein
MDGDGRKEEDKKIFFWYYCSEENWVKKETKSKRGG